MVLVTGATGLLGSYLTKLLLAKGERVRAIRRASSNLSLLEGVRDKIEWVEADVLDVPSLEDAMNGIEKVYHCAAVITFIPSRVNHMMKVNIEGAANVMNAALAEGVKKVVHVSSIAAFGVAPDDKVIDEKYSDPNINKSFWYYRSKQHGEREAWRAHAEGLNVVIVNPSTILGAGWWDDEPNSLFRDIHHGLKFYTTATMGFVDVRDVAQCMYQLMESDISGEKFIINSEHLTFRELMWQIADDLGTRRPTIRAGKFLRSLAWRIEAIKTFFSNAKPLVTQESAALAGISFRFSNQKIKQAINYSFKPVKETIAETAKAYLHSVKQGKEYGAF